MITFMKTWCEGIIVAVMISIIIELLIPEGNNKKYVKVVIGIYILFVILSPILEKANKGEILGKILEIDSIEASIDVDNNIKDVYIDGIEETIKNKIIEQGFFVKNVSISVDYKYENIEKINIELAEKKTNSNNIKIDSIKITEANIKENEYEKLKEIIAKDYQVSVQNIYIFESK